MSIKKLPFSLCIALLAIHSAHAQEDFKRYSISAGWIRIVPLGKPTQFNINTAVSKDQKYNVGSIKPDTLSRSIDDSRLLAQPVVMPVDPSSTVVVRSPASVDRTAFLRMLIPSYATDENNNFQVPGSLSGNIQLNGVDQWQQPNTGLEARSADTLGLMMNYNLSDNISFQIKAGIPPKVKIRGKGQIVVKARGDAYPGDAFNDMILPIKQDLLITDLGGQKNVAQARAWTPAFEIQYVFGKSGVNKFRPFIGVGAVYAKFTHIKLDKSTKRDLEIAGHMVQNILDGKVGDSVEKYDHSSAEVKVKAKSSDELAPIATIGFNLDITPTIYATAAVSYSKMNTRTDITAKNLNNGQTLTQSTTRLNIDPVVTYVGVGYRF